MNYWRSDAVRIVLLTLGIFLFTCLEYAFGQEARCGALGAACICSEPYQGATYTVNSGYYKASDSPTGAGKACDSIGGIPNGGWSTFSNIIPVFKSTDATALAALPAGNSVTGFAGNANNYAGTFLAGNYLTASQPHGRTCMRWYRWYSPDYIFADEGATWSATTGNG